MVLNDLEKKALQEKLDNPEQYVKCPRCGNEITYEKRGNSIAVGCKSDYKYHQSEKD